MANTCFVLKLNELGHYSAKLALDTYGHLMPGVENDAGIRLDDGKGNLKPYRAAGKWS